MENKLDYNFVYALGFVVMAVFVGLSFWSAVGASRPTQTPEICEKTVIAYLKQFQPDLVTKEDGHTVYSWIVTVVEED